MANQWTSKQCWSEGCLVKPTMVVTRDSYRLPFCTKHGLYWLKCERSFRRLRAAMVRAYTQQDGFWTKKRNDLAMPVLFVGRTVDQRHSPAY